MAEQFTKIFSESKIIQRLVLIDRDGTVNLEKYYISDPEQIELLPKSAEALKLLRDLGLRVLIVTNQLVIGRRFFYLETLEKFIVACKLCQIKKIQQLMQFIFVRIYPKINVIAASL